MKYYRQQEAPANLEKAHPLSLPHMQTVKLLPTKIQETFLIPLYLSSRPFSYERRVVSPRSTQRAQSSFFLMASSLTLKMQTWPPDSDAPSLLTMQMTFQLIFWRQLQLSVRQTDLTLPSTEAIKLVVAAPPTTAGNFTRRAFSHMSRG